MSEQTMTMLIFASLPILIIALGVMVYFKFVNKNLPPGPKRTARIFFGCWLFSMTGFTILFASFVLVNYKEIFPDGKTSLFMYSFFTLLFILPFSVAGTLLLVIPQNFRELYRILYSRKPMTFFFEQPLIPTVLLLRIMGGFLFVISLMMAISVITENLTQLDRDRAESAVSKYETYQTWHVESLREITPEVTFAEGTGSRTDLYGVEKVVYTKASYNSLAFGITKDLVLANIDGSSKDTVLQDVPDTSGLSRFILLPESKEVVLAVPGVTTLQKIDFEKINLETRERVKFGTYKQKFGVELQGAIVSPDQKKLVFTTSGMRVFLMHLDKSGDVPSEPIYTAEIGMLIPEVWDKKGNVYLSNFLCFPCFPREVEKNTPDLSPSYILQINIPKKRLIFFRNIESYAFSPDNNYFAWVERQENSANLKVKVYSAKDDAIWVVDSCKALPETLTWRDATHVQYKVVDKYSQYANVVYDVESHTRDMNPIPPSYKIERRITHDVKIEEGLERGSVKGAKLYINGTLIDEIEKLSVPYGHNSAFEVIGFIHGKPVEEEEPKLLSLSYLPENITLTDVDKVKYYKCVGVICEVDIVGNFGVLRIRQFADIESLYFSPSLIDDPAGFKHLIMKEEDVTFDGGKGIYYDLGTLPRERRLYFDKGDSKIQFFCYGGCTLSKEELIKIAQSMTTQVTYSIADTSTWQTYRNEEFRFEFQYPKVFDEYSSCELRDILGDKTLTLGNSISIFVEGTEELSLEEYVTRDFHSESQFDISRRDILVDGKDAIQIGSRTEGLGRYSETTYVLDQDKVYVFTYQARPNCLPYEVSDESELSALQQILSTFRFTPTSKSVSTGVTREITITAKKNQWRFMPEEFEVKQGDGVVLTVVNEDDYDHGFAIDLFGISQRIQGNSIIKVEFVADQAGDFPFYSSVPSGGGIVDGKERTYYDMAGQMHVRSLIPRTK